MTSTELQKLADSFYPLIAKARKKASDLDDMQSPRHFDFEVTADHLQVAFSELSNAARELGALESKGETL